MEILKSINVLVIDDKREDLELLSKVMKIFFNRVYISDNPIEGFEIYKNEEIHAIFTDFEMPFMNGYELTKEIRAKNKNISITMISNHDDKYLLQKCIPLGLSGYLFKPLGFSKIKNYLEELANDLSSKDMLSHRLSDRHIFNHINGTLEVDSKTFHLTKLEHRFLNIFVNTQSNFITKEQIYAELEDEKLNENSIKNLVYRMKKKYEFDKIKSIKNIGYMLFLDEE